MEVFLKSNDLNIIDITNQTAIAPFLIVMCGLQCSGKSTLAQSLSIKYQADIVSSDDIRLRYPEMNNDQVFKRVYYELNEILGQGVNAILDATNITIKSRRQIFNNIKVVCNKICYIVNTPYTECVERLKFRNASEYPNKIPLEVLERYYQSFEIPFYEEGWNGIEIVNKPDVDKSTFNLNKLRDAAAGFNQQNKHHTQDLGQHMFTVGNKLKEMNMPLIIQEAGYYHDIGKLFTQTKGKDGECHYYNHDNVGAYTLLCFAGMYDFVDGYVYNTARTLEWLFYINYHMRLHNVETEKSIKKWKIIFSETKFDMLKQFIVADKFRLTTNKQGE